jgi:hypothetical protein
MEVSRDTVEKDVGTSGWSCMSGSVLFTRNAGDTDRIRVGIVVETQVLYQSVPDESLETLVVKVSKTAVP